MCARQPLNLLACEYDAQVNISQVSPDTGTANATYDVAGNLSTRTDSRVVLATYSYTPSVIKVKTLLIRKKSI